MPMGGITRVRRLEKRPSLSGGHGNMPPIGIYNGGGRGRPKSSIKWRAGVRRGIKRLA